LRPLRWLRSKFRWTVRVRLTLVYGGLFFVVGAGLLTVAYFLFRGITGTTTLAYGNRKYLVSTLRVTPAGSIEVHGAPFGTSVHKTAAFVALQPQDAVDLHRLLVELGLVLILMSFVALGLGWVIAGRALRPLRTITQTAGAISARSLHERLASTGPHDELRELSDTFDGLLARLESSFEAQRRFIHHASHELRTPITRQRTVVEVTLADPGASVASLREMGDRVLATGEEQERLIEGLLTLARTEELTTPLELVDLAAIATEVLELRASAIAKRGIELTTAIEPAIVAGDAGMIERLLANVVDNAIEHNIDAGSIAVSVAPTMAGACFTARNSGQAVSSDEVEMLLHPLEHRHDDGRRARQHHGLGLAIVQAIASVHGASLRLSPLATGGLEVAVEFTN
jgi:signal transduction histidine kinase